MDVSSLVFMERCAPHPPRAPRLPPAVNTDVSNHNYSKKLLDVLQLVADDGQRLHFFENAVRGFLKAGNREQAGILSLNLAESMDRNNGLRDSRSRAVQQTLFRRSIRLFLENPIAVRSLGYRLEQGHEDERQWSSIESLWRGAQQDG